MMLLVVLVPTSWLQGQQLLSLTFSEQEPRWKALRDCELKVTDEGLLIRCTGDDPHLESRLDLPAGWLRLDIEARFRGRMDGQVFWAASGEGYAESRSEVFTARGNPSQLQRITVFIKAERPIASLRLDPLKRKGQVTIASLTLSREEPHIPMAPDASDLRVHQDFEVQRVYSVPAKEQGSWVAMTCDPHGRLITSDQYGRLYRVTPAHLSPQGDLRVEPIGLDIGSAQGLLYAFDSLYVMVNAGPKSGLYRVTDEDGDDQFDQVKLLRGLKGNGEHGPHAIVLSPDRQSLYVSCGNHTDPTEFAWTALPATWQEDQLLPRMWDARGHARGRMAPGGWIARVSPDGAEWELVSAGFRNQYDIAFNAEGELFTYDADMEWDVGSPWYRPTRINHVTMGSEFGWRSGTGKWPTWYEDSLPAVVDIGPGSPTGIAFGSGAAFPEKYQRALFICDWSYGIIYAVHLTPEGASYAGVAEQFISGTPLPVTDLVVNPADQSLYFTIGGRKTQSGLYRVTYRGELATSPVSPKDLNAAAKLRRSLEAGFRQPEMNLQIALQQLGHEDRFVRYAARIALEHHPLANWEPQALSHTNPLARINGAIAVARSTGTRTPDTETTGAAETAASKQRLVESLVELPWQTLTQTERLGLLRAYGLTFARLGPPDSAQRMAILKQVDPHFPARQFQLNRELAALLVYLQAPDVAGRTLDLLAAAPTQEEQIAYALSLRVLKLGWTDADRERYFDWFLQAAEHRGGASFTGFLRNIRDEAIANLSDREREALQELLARKPVAKAPDITTRQREFVRKWQLGDFELSDTALHGRDLESGRRIFAEAVCFKCHRFQGEGGTVGPDLTAVAGRFSNRDLLESLLDPSKTVSDQYQATIFQLASGQTVVGRVVNLSGNRLSISENMLEPGKLTNIQRDEIEATKPSPTSLMPESLLDTFSREEILDLLAYLKSGRR